MDKIAVISGVSGQDGSYLADLLLQKNYTVHGISRRTANKNTQRIEHVLNHPKFTLHYGDVTDLPSIIRILDKTNPYEFYNLAAQSFVGTSWEQPILTSNATALGVLNCLEAIRTVNSKIKFLQASSSEMFGKVRETPQNENTPFHPRSPYGVSKVFGHQITVNYRESYGLFACSCIMFNHESPRRGIEFVTRKITDAVARIQRGLADHVALGNTNAKRDWGHSRDYMEAAWLILQQENADDFVVSTGETYSVDDFLKEAFSYIGIEEYKHYVKIDPRFIRPSEVDLLIGDSSKLKLKTGWYPKTSFKQLVEEMMIYDTVAIANEILKKN